ncbi:hypothetical protein Y1Q_0023038 [Alligator mississippiensis]|uniref:Reverse transcriptase domain-containing protein n=1 Tax=Alligator mississippiensis TaxID=8496 RepID=A0A151P7H6_ALLMI|nr:hypothetical protein Y1Q_0023038 [Alligator mississippiensis]
MKNYDALKTIYGPWSSGTSPILSADGTTLLIDKGKTLQRWAEPFSNILNQQSSISEEEIDQLHQVDINIALADSPTLTEVVEAINLLSNGKAPGADAIPGEICKAGGLYKFLKLTEFFKSMWTRETIPQEYKDGSIIHLYNQKSYRQSCDNHWCIFLLSIASQILSRILLDHLVQHIEQRLLPESQCGFRKGCGNIDIAFATHRLQEKCQELYSNLYMTSIGLKKRI